MLEIVDILESAKVVFTQWKRVQDKIFDQSLRLMTSDDGNEH